MEQQTVNSLMIHSHRTVDNVIIQSMLEIEGDAQTATWRDSSVPTGDVRICASDAAVT